MNLPNRLTVARFVMTAFMVAGLSLDFPFARTAALILFIAASLTDWLDGAIARKTGSITDFGKLMDPLADKVLVAGAFVALIPHGLVEAWLVIVVLAREFLITGLRLLAAGRGVLLSAAWSGKLKTTFQMIAASLFMLVLAVPEWTATHAPAPKLLLLPALVAWYGAVLAAVASGAEVVWKNRALYADTG